MPRIKGIGELDWSFPHPVIEIHTMSTGRILSMWIQLDELIVAGDSASLVRIDYKGGEAESGEREKAHLRLPAPIRRAARELSREYSSVSLSHLPSEARVYLSLETEEHAEPVRFPSRFIDAMAKKIERLSRMESLRDFRDKELVLCFLRDSSQQIATMGAISEALRLSLMRVMRLLDELYHERKVGRMLSSPPPEKWADEEWSARRTSSLRAISA